MPESGIHVCAKCGLVESQVIIHAAAPNVGDPCAACMQPFTVGDHTRRIKVGLDDKFCIRTVHKACADRLTDPLEIAPGSETINFPPPETSSAPEIDSQDPPSLLTALATPPDAPKWGDADYDPANASPELRQQMASVAATQFVEYIELVNRPNLKFEEARALWAEIVSHAFGSLGRKVPAELETGQVCEGPGRGAEWEDEAAEPDLSAIEAFPKLTAEERAAATTGRPIFGPGPYVEMTTGPVPVANCQLSGAGSSVEYAQNQAARKAHFHEVVIPAAAAMGGRVVTGNTVYQFNRPGDPFMPPRSHSDADIAAAEAYAAFAAGEDNMREAARAWQPPEPFSVMCPMCKAEGRHCVVYEHGTTQTLLAGSTYYDRQGRKHRHDPNTSTTRMSCSNGHQWQVHHRGDGQPSEPSNAQRSKDDAALAQYFGIEAGPLLLALQRYSDAVRKAEDNGYYIEPIVSEDSRKWPPKCKVDEVLGPFVDLHEELLTAFRSFMGACRLKDPQSAASPPADNRTESGGTI